MSCSTIVNSRNDAFAIPQFTDQTSLSGTAIDAENAFVSSAFPGCSAGGNYGSSFAHVAVSVLTISSSTHVGQATPAPSPVPVAQSPTIPATKTASQLANRLRLRNLLLLNLQTRLPLSPRTLFHLSPPILLPPNPQMGLLNHQAQFLLHP